MARPVAERNQLAVSHEWPSNARVIVRRVSGRPTKAILVIEVGDRLASLFADVRDQAPRRLLRVDDGKLALGIALSVRLDLVLVSASAPNIGELLDAKDRDPTLAAVPLFVVGEAESREDILAAVERALSASPQSPR